MKEKRYFNMWWDNMEKKKKTKCHLIMIGVAALVVLGIMLYLGSFEVSDYPEDEYVNLEAAYLPYVHEGVGIDIIGLKGAVHGLKDPIITDSEIQITYGYISKSVTIILDKNYVTKSIERSTYTESEYKRSEVVTTIADFLLFTFLFYAIELVIGLLIHMASIAHQGLDEFIAKHKRNP